MGQNSCGARISGVVVNTAFRGGRMGAITSIRLRLPVVGTVSNVFQFLVQGRRLDARRGHSVRLTCGRFSTVRWFRSPKSAAHRRAFLLNVGSHGDGANRGRRSGVSADRGSGERTARHSRQKEGEREAMSERTVLRHSDICRLMHVEPSVDQHTLREVTNSLVILAHEHSGYGVHNDSLHPSCSRSRHAAAASASANARTSMPWRRCGRELSTFLPSLSIRIICS